MNKGKNPPKTKKPTAVRQVPLISAVDAARMSAEVQAEPFTVEIKRWAEAIAEGVINGANAVVTDRMPSRQAYNELVKLGYVLTPQADGGICVSWAGALQHEQALPLIDHPTLTDPSAPA